jgi:hypothetical protein
VEGLKHLGAKHWMVGTVGDQALAMHHSTLSNIEDQISEHAAFHYQTLHSKGDMVWLQPPEPKFVSILRSPGIDS